ncbi:MAG TPA: hypothetical protein VF736_12045 [Pyrinomonadaceae bacterium]
MSIVLCAAASGQEVGLGGARQKITVVSAVRARGAPEVGAQELTRLKLGTVLSADARSAAQAEIAGKTDYWYRVALPGGGQGWVFGGLLADYDPARRRESVRRVVEGRLQAETLSFDDALDFYNFVEGEMAGAGGTSKGELELARLHALNRAATATGQTMDGKPTNPDFVKAHQRELYYHEFAGQWAVEPERFWELETKYRGTPLGDRIAWDAAQALYGGECESDEVCQFIGLEGTQGRYLGLYPKGAHASEALQALSEALASEQLAASLNNKSRDKYAAEERTALRKALAELRAAVSKADAPEKASVLRRLNQLLPAGR